eukprot:PhM_4_TR13381/c0_g1_i1/m.74662
MSIITSRYKVQYEIGEVQPSADGTPLTSVDYLRPPARTTILNAYSTFPCISLGELSTPHEIGIVACPSDRTTLMDTAGGDYTSVEASQYLVTPLAVIRVLLLKFSTVAHPGEILRVLNGVGRARHGSDFTPIDAEVFFHLLMVMARDGWLSCLLSTQHPQCGVVRITQLGLDSLGYHHVVDADTYGDVERSLTAASELWRKSLRRSTFPNTDEGRGLEYEMSHELSDTVVVQRYPQWRWRQSLLTV